MQSSKPMPINRGSHISAVVEEVKHLKPESILDIGVGFGMMGVIFRAYTDIRMSEISPDRYFRHGYQTKIDGIEIFENYRNPIWEAYDFVYIGNAFSAIDSLQSYSLIYAGDVIEHFEKEQGHEFIKKALRKCDKLIIATPSPAPKQEELLGNKFETHLSSWEASDFVEYGHEVIGNFDGILVVRLWKK
jgi:hypothetical protein